MSRGQQLDRLRRAAPSVLPSLLLCDFGNLRSEVERLESAGVKGLHLDVMDGQFVPNLTYGMPIVAALRQLTELPLDVHLMIQDPGRYITPFVESGADLITIHVEASGDVAGDLQRIRELGVASGLALNPGTPIGQIEQYLKHCDLVLVMSVEAGFGGQKFNPLALEKISYLKQRINEDLLLEVDGGINSSTIGSCAEAGADLFVVGSAIFRQPDYGLSVTELELLAQPT